MPAPYIAAIARQIRDVVVDSPADAVAEPVSEQLYAAYALLVLTKGDAVTTSDVHDAWASVHDDETADAADLVPFDQLSAAVQQRDERFAAAIRAVAATRARDANG